MASLKASRAEAQLVESLVDTWRRYGGEIRRSLADGVPSDAQVRRWVAGIGRLDIGAFMRLSSGLWAAARRDGREAPSSADVRALYRRMRVSAMRDPIDLGALAVDGDDLRRAGIPAGPTLGMILRALLDTVIADPAMNSADVLLNEAQRQHELLAANSLVRRRDSQET
jgi:tRNA nucleotidyltransferase (CCA-adding enzyme)